MSLEKDEFGIPRSRFRLILGKVILQENVPLECKFIDSSEDLEKVLRSNDRLTVLFYASWCPFSQRFLPDFLEHAKASDQCFMRVVMDDKDDLVRKYAIEVYPTVLFFQHGKVAKRLDGIFHVGLNKHQLEEFVKRCRV